MVCIYFTYVIWPFSLQQSLQCNPCELNPLFHPCNASSALQNTLFLWKESKNRRSRPGSNYYKYMPVQGVPPTTGLSCRKHHNYFKRRGGQHPVTPVTQITLGRAFYLGYTQSSGYPGLDPLSSALAFLHSQNPFLSNVTLHSTPLSD